MWPALPNSLKFGLSKSSSATESTVASNARSVVNAVSFIGSVQSSVRSGVDAGEHDGNFHHAFSPVLSALPSAPLTVRTALAHVIAQACSELCPTSSHHAWCRGWLPYLSTRLLCLPQASVHSVLLALGPMQALEAPYPPREGRKSSRPMSTLYAAATTCGEAGESARCRYLPDLPPVAQVRLAYIRDLVVLHMLLGIYDARARTMLRGTCHVLGISWAEIGSSEDALCDWLRGVQERAAHGQGGADGMAGVSPPFPKVAWPGQAEEESSLDMNTPCLVPATPTPAPGIGLTSGLSQGSSSQLVASAQGGARSSASTEAAIKMAKIAAGTVIGAGLMAVTGGLAAAPLLGAAAGLVAGVGSGGAVATAVLSALSFLQAGTGLGILVGIFGATGAGLGSYRMSRRLADISEFRFESLSHEAGMSEVGRRALGAQRKAVAGGREEEEEGSKQAQSPGYHVLIAITGLVVSRHGEDHAHEMAGPVQREAGTGTGAGAGAGTDSGTETGNGSQASAATPASSSSAYSFSLPTFPRSMFRSGSNGSPAPPAAPSPPPSPYHGMFDFIRPWGDWTNAEPALAPALEACGAVLGEGSQEEAAAVQAQARQEGQVLQECLGAEQQQAEETARGTAVEADPSLLPLPSSSSSESNLASALLARAGWTGSTLVTYSGLHLVPVWRVSGGKELVRDSVTHTPGGRLYARAFASLPWIIGCPGGELLPEAWMEAAGSMDDVPQCSPSRGWLLLLRVPACRALPKESSEEQAREGQGEEEMVSVGWVGISPICPTTGSSSSAPRVECRVVLLHPIAHGGRTWARDALLSIMRSMNVQGGRARVEWLYRPPVVLGHGLDDTDARPSGRGRSSALLEDNEREGDPEPEEEEEEEGSALEPEDLQEAIRMAQRGRAGPHISLSADSSALEEEDEEESVAFASAASAALVSALACGYKVVGRVQAAAYRPGGQGHTGHVEMTLLQGSIAYARAVGALQAQLASAGQDGAASSSGQPQPSAPAPAPTPSAGAETPSSVFSLPTLPTVNASQLQKDVLATTSHVGKVLSTLAVVNAGAIESKRGWARKAVGHGEIVSLVWESALLAELGDYITQYVQQYLASELQGRLVSRALSFTLLAPLVAATQGFQTMSDILSMYIDALWQRVRIKAGKCGRVLARVLLDPSHGSRPTSVVGWGQGARLMYKALEELAVKAEEQQAKAVKAVRAARQKTGLPSVGHNFEPEFASDEDIASAAAAGSPFPWAFTPPVEPGQRKTVGTTGDKSPYGIIQDAILMGSPVGADPESWSKLRPFVSGRMVNGYCTRDFMLRVVYRVHQLAWEAAGLRPIGVQSHADMYTALSKELALPDATPVLKSITQAVPLPLPTLPTTSAVWKAAGYAEDGDVRAEAFASIGQSSGPESNDPRGPGYSSLPPCAPTAEAWRGITSVDLTPIVQGHLEYRNKLAAAIAYIGLDAAM